MMPVHRIRAGMKLPSVSMFTTPDKMNEDSGAGVLPSAMQTSSPW